MHKILDIEEMLLNMEANPKNVYARILEGQVPEHFETMTFRPHERFLVMLMDYEGLHQLHGLNILEALKKIGYPSDYIENRIKEEFKYKLLVFEDSSEVKVGTWDNVIDLAAQAYPQWQERLYRQLPQLKSLSNDEILAQGGEVLEVRSFLEDTMNYNRLYTGKGYTMTEDGEMGLKEYVRLNCPLSELGNYVLKDL